MHKFKSETYIYSILEELRFGNGEPTAIYSEKMLYIMINESKNPTERDKYIYIQQFTLQYCFGLV